MTFSCYNGKRVLVTGHTGFKGSWLCEWLLTLGAEVHGFSLPPPTKPSLFNQLKLAKRIKSHTIGDIRDLKAVTACIKRVKPDIIFHLAAQPLVLLSYKRPVETFDTNVMGTIHILEAARKIGRKCSIVCITTDKVYENNDKGVAFKEGDALGGYDPYSASKGACEVAIQSYRRAFFLGKDCPIRVASARAGNVIGGGDWALDRIVPDAMRAWLGKKVERRGGGGRRTLSSECGVLTVRNSRSTRPWQHVLEPLSGYLMLGEWLATKSRTAKLKPETQDAFAFNFGPDPKNVKTVGALVTELTKNLKTLKSKDLTNPKAVHEAKLLTLNSAKAAKILKWTPSWDFKTTIAQVATWYDEVMVGKRDAIEVTRRQIAEFCA